jgi:hypothetical protein
MNTDRQNALYEAWPQIFRQKDLGPADTSMCWGVQCDDGWAGLIDALCAVTTAHAHTGAHPVLAATTVKQKFASLRVHFDQRCEFCDGARRLVEAFSTRVCEVTGRPGVRCAALGGGVKTLASDIAVQLGFEVDQPEQPHRHESKAVPAGWHSIADSLVGGRGDSQSQHGARVRGRRRRPPCDAFRALRSRRSRSGSVRGHSLSTHRSRLRSSYIPPLGPNVLSARGPRRWGHSRFRSEPIRALTSSLACFATNASRSRRVSIARGFARSVPINDAASTSISSSEIVRPEIRRWMYFSASSWIAAYFWLTVLRSFDPNDLTNAEPFTPVDGLR